MKLFKVLVVLNTIICFITTLAFAQMLYRLNDGITFYLDNPEGKDFSIKLTIADLNFFEEGAREILFKVYAPDGNTLVREFIPDDGITNNLFAGRALGWDHELQYYADLYLKGIGIPFRWSELFDEKRLAQLSKRDFQKDIKVNGKKGVYRMVMAGSKDIIFFLSTQPQLKHAVVGHPEWLIFNSKQPFKKFIYIPKNTEAISFAFAEPDQPATRLFKLIAPDGKLLTEGKADGIFRNFIIPLTNTTYQEKNLTLEIAGGNNAFMVHCNLLQPKVGAFAEYTGMGSLALFCDDAELSTKLQGGTILYQQELFWHPFQINLYKAIQNYEVNLNTNDQEAVTNLAILKQIFNGMRLICQSDARGSVTWNNLAYSLGYSGCKIFRPIWLVMQSKKIPQEIKDIIKDATIMIADRLSVATGIERVNGNAFSQINVALFYAAEATKDPFLKQRFEIFWDRWANSGWSKDCGISPSGDVLESFGHDMHYGSYILANWKGKGPWITNGIIEDASQDHRFKEALSKIEALYSYLYCQSAKNVPIAANPWSSRTSLTSHNFEHNWRTPENQWKAKSPSNFIISINHGNEWVAAKQQNYYVLIFYGKLPPSFVSDSFGGQCGFGGGVIAQLTIPDKEPIMASTLYGSYGEGMHISNWRNFHIHTLAGSLWDGTPFVSAISEPAGKLDGNKLNIHGEIRNSPLHFFRNYEFHTDKITASITLSNSIYEPIMHLWKKPKYYADIKEAYEIIPLFIEKPGKNIKQTLIVDSKQEFILPTSSNIMASAKAINIFKGDYGLLINLDRDRKIIITSNNTLLIEVINSTTAMPATNAALSYDLQTISNLKLTK